MITSEFQAELDDYLASLGINKEHFQYSRYIEGHTDIERFDKYFDEIERFIPIKGSSVLDIGCGSGGTIENLAKRGAKVSAIEISDPLVKLSNIRAKAYSGCSCVKADALSLPFPDDTFNICISMDLIEHLDDPARHILEMKRVLRSGGIIALSTPNWFFRLERHTRFRYIHRFPIRLGRYYADFVIKHGLFSEEYRQRMISMRTLRNYFTVFRLKRMAKRLGLNVLWYRPGIFHFGDPVIHMLMQKGGR